jgi:hypothetical protein
MSIGGLLGEADMADAPDLCISNYRAVITLLVSRVNADSASRIQRSGFSGNIIAPNWVAFLLCVPLDRS